MKFNIKTIITAIVAVCIGLLMGYFIFGKNSPETVHNHGAEMAETTTSDEIWTCSMHPQIRQPEPGLCPICEMDLIPLESNVSDDPLVLQMTKTAVEIANIRTTIIGGSSKTASEKTVAGLRLSGKIQADERRVATQTVHIPGRIEQLFVTFEGEQVKQGQRLATVYSPDLITAQRELLEALKLQDLNPDLVTAARNKLRYLKISDAVIQQIETEGKIRETFTIYADNSGVVTKRLVSVGDYVRTGETLFQLVNLNQLWVIFDAYESDLANISVGDRVEFTTPALPDQTFTTRIDFINPVINPETRIAEVRASIKNRRGVLKPEMFVSGTLQTRPIAKTVNNQLLTVPKSAVLWTGKRSVIYVKLPDTDIPSYQYREVEIGDSMGDSYAVLAGLEVGEEVVTNGNFSIDAAAQLNNQASMMNKNIEIKGEQVVEVVPDYQAETPAAFQQQLNAVVAAYINLKDAFVATDASAASTAAMEVLTQLKKVDMSLVKGEAHEYWMQQGDAIRDHTTLITEADDVEKQRKQFDFLSQALIKTVQAFGAETTLYVQHCPMAFDNEGADWLATEEGIRNPYFGDRMMKCGLVKDEIVGDKDETD